MADCKQYHRINYSQL